MLRKYVSLGSLFIIIAAVLWGLDGVWRRSLYELPSEVVVFYEHLIGFLIILPWLLNRKTIEGWDKKSAGAIVVVSIVSGIFGTFWFTKALSMVGFIPFSVVLLLQKLQPLFAIAAAAIILKEKVTTEYLKWGGLALIAAYFVTFPEGSVDYEKSPDTVQAALYAVGAAAAWGSSTALSRYALLRQPHTIVTGVRFGIVTLVMLGWFLLAGKQPMLSIPTIENMWTLSLIALSTGMVALWLYYRGLQTTKASHATILELVFPLTAVLIEPYLYKTNLEPVQYYAAVVLVFAIFKVAGLQNRKKQTAIIEEEEKVDQSAESVTEDTSKINKPVRKSITPTNAAKKKPATKKAKKSSSVKDARG